MSLITDAATIVRRLRDGKPCIDAQNNEPCRCRDAAAGCDCTIAAEEIERKDAIIAKLRAAIFDIGDLANKTLQGEDILYGVALRDMIFRCAAVIAPDVTVGDADEQTPQEDTA